MWPTNPAGFRQTWLASLAAVDRVANDLMSAAAIALGMPANHFETSGSAARRARRSGSPPFGRMFQQPNWDAVIECLPSCDESNPPRYAPVTSGEHLLAKLMGPRLLRPSDAAPRT